MEKERESKLILVSYRMFGILHWRLIVAKKQGKHYQIGLTAFNRFVAEIYERKETGK